MQEPIQPQMPGYQSYQGVTPTTDWVMMNIGGFYEAKNSGDVLEQINKYARYLQHQKEIRQAQQQQAVLAQGKPTTIPTKGTPDEIANAAGYNVTQSLVRTQIMSLSELLAILIKDNPKLAEELKQFVTELENMQSSFPTVSEEHLETLTQIMKVCEQMYPTMSSKDMQKEYGKKEFKMLKELYKTLDSANEECDETLSSLKGQTMWLMNSQQLLAQLGEMLQMLFNKNGKLSGRDVQQMVGVLQALLASGGKLSPSTRKQIAALIAQLKGMKSTDGTVSLGDILNEYESTGQISGYEERDPEETVMELDPLDVASTQPNAKKALTAVDDDLGDVQNQTDGISRTRQMLGDTQNMVGKAAPNAVSKHVAGGGSVADSFSHAILDHYMKEQQEYLEALAFVLYFANLGAGIGNELLTDTMDFEQANVNYTFGSGFHATTGGFSGSYTQAKSDLSAEKAQVSKDLANCRSALSYIQQQINDIENNKTLSASQKSTLLSQLKQTQTDLNQSIGFLTPLKTVLDEFTVVKTSAGFNVLRAPSNNPVTSTAWSWLAAAQQNVITSLQSTQSFISKNQQNYSNQGQTQQMILQMRMTEIQQEWTVVSTCLQTLNQMYMAFAQGISPT